MDGRTFDEAGPASRDVTKSTSREAAGFYAAAMETPCSNPETGGDMIEVDAMFETFISHVGDDTDNRREENLGRVQTNFGSDALWRRARVRGSVVSGSGARNGASEELHGHAGD